VQRHADLAPLAEAISTFRKASGFTQEGFAYEAKLDRGFVGAVERAERNVGFRKMRQLLVGLGVNWREFGAALHDLDPIASRRRSR
jgi:transcriptional regulator with XRE-family HTH domain